MDKYSELIVFIEQMPKLISETDFNWLLSNDNRVWQLLRSSQQLFLRLLVYEANPEKQCRQNLLTS